MARAVTLRVGSPGVGLILIWSGTAASIPDGYVLCDGENGTPDMRDKFVCGAYWSTWEGEADDPWPVRDLGHTHTYSDAELQTTGSAHSHTVDEALGNYPDSGVSEHATTEGLAHDGYTTAADAHTHPMVTPTEALATAADETGEHHHNVSGALFAPTHQEVDITPPYYALCYIMGRIAAADVPVGGIVMWPGDGAFGTPTNLPAGFVRCDGQNGTPNMRDTFAIGAGLAYTVGDEGGSGYLDGDHDHHTGTNASAESGHRHYNTGWDCTEAEATETETVAADYYLTPVGYSPTHSHMSPPFGSVVTSPGSEHTHSIALNFHSVAFNDSEYLLPPTVAVHFLMRVA